MKAVKLLMVMAILLMQMMVFASVAGATATANPSGKLDISGLSNVDSSDSTTSAKNIQKELDKWITNLRTIGAVVAIFGIVIGGILFSVSLGNSQRRGLAISSMLSGGVGIVIVAKAPAIAGYFINAG